MRGFLNNLVRNFRTAKTARPARRSPRRTNLQVEGLEQRDTPAVTFHGGAVLSHVEVQPLYLGSDWVANTTLLNQTIQFNSFLNTLVNSSYMDMLTYAYGSQTVDANGKVASPGTAGTLTVTPPIGHGTTSPMDLDLLNIDKTQYLTDAQIQTDIKKQINVPGGLLNPDPNRLYVVFVEPGVAVQTTGGTSVINFGGFHSEFAYNSDVVHYAVIPYSGSSTKFGRNISFDGLNAFDSMTMTTSHELAESVTNPDFYSSPGWTDDSFGQTHGGANEVGDIVSSQTVYLHGYAVQRIADPNDQAMTPLGATAASPADFVLRADGTLWKNSITGFTSVLQSVASISDQGIDNNGQAMIDEISTYGSATELHWTPSGAPFFIGLNPPDHSSFKQVEAGQGVSYMLMADGNLWEYNDATQSYKQIDGSVQSINAGTDAHGVNMVAYVRTDWFERVVTVGGVPHYQLYTQSDGYESSDSGGRQLIADNVQSMSAGRQGNIAYVTTSGVAFWYSRSLGGVSILLGSGVATVSAGADQNGYLVLDVLSANGLLSEWRQQSGAWTTVAGKVASIGKAHNGVLDFVFSGSSGDAYRYDGHGLSFLIDNATTAA